MKNYLPLIIFLCLILYSCKSVKFWNPECSNSRGMFHQTQVIENIDLKDYSVYVLNIYQSKINEVVKGRKEFIPIPKYTIKPTETSTLVIEQTYLLIPNDNNCPLLYLTSYSHKYLLENYGAYNCHLFKDKIFLDDVDMIYIGYITNNSFVFRNKDGVFKWDIEFRDNKKLIKVNSITDIDSRGQNKPQVDLSTVFSIPIEFSLEKRFLTYGRSDEDILKCYQDGGLKKPTYKKTRKYVGGKIDNISILSNRVYFHNSKKNLYYFFKNNRIPYNIDK